MLHQGETLAGYRIESIAGIGGMGVVYRATQLSLDRPVALKVLSSTLVGNRSFRERFRREGRHAAALEHPNIIPVYEAGESNGLMFIAMRLIDGPTLADVMHRGELTGKEALRIVGAIASALDAAHEAGLVHRDVKPQNILLTAAGHPYLADFGITKGSQSGGLTRTGDFVGSLSYVAPEQMDGAEVGPQSDVYSLAAVLFQCLTGALPYERDTDAALMHAHLFAPPPSIAELGVDVPSALDDVFARGMAKRAEDRYETAGEMVSDCEAAITSLPADVLERAPSFPKPEAEEPEAPPPDNLVGDAPGARAGSLEPVAATLPVPALGEQTAADRKRASSGGVPDEPGAQAPAATRGAPSTRRVPVAAVAGVLIAAPIIGFLLGGGDDAPASKQVASSQVSLSRPADWKDATPSLSGMKLDGAVGLSDPSGVVLTAGRVSDPAPGLDPTTTGFRGDFERARPTPIRLGDRDMLRYAGTLKSGGTGWVVFAPDTKGWIAIGCRSAVGGAAVADRCVPVAASLKAVGTDGIALRPDSQLAKTLRSAVDRLNSERRGAAAALRSKRHTLRATAAARLATEHARAAKALSAASRRVQDRPLVVPLAAALRAESDAWSELAAAARKKDRAAYDSARKRVAAAETRVRRALRGLERGGYVVAGS